MMMFILDKRSYELLFKNASVESVTIEEITKAEEDVSRIQKALDNLKKRVIDFLSGSLNEGSHK